MRFTSILTLLVAVTVVMSGIAFAGEIAKQDSTVKAPAELKQQTNCPVMGGKIDSTQYTDIQGQRVYHCCGMCSAKLKADPDKYFKKAAEEGILFENVQTFCPVSGKKLEKKETYADYEGRRVYFCCPNCIPTFNKDPQKYLSVLDKPAPSEEKSEMGGMKMKMDHSSTEQSGENH